MELTDREQEVLTFITGHIEDRRYSPSLVEIADAFDITKSGAAAHVRALIGKGALRREKGARSLVPVD